MATTISNNELGAVAKTSDHKAATSGATDVNWNPPVKVQVPHANEAKSADATQHTTSKTKFQNGNVVRQGDAIGPPSGPPHGDNGAGGGVKSGTHLKEARVTTGSTDVKVEGKPLARSTDPTTNNSANTNGKMKGADPTEEAKRLEQEKKKACSMVSVTAKCDHEKSALEKKVEESGKALKNALPDNVDYEVCTGRHPGGEKFLEVVCAVKVVLEAKRKNAKEASKPVECEKNEHTTWLVSKWHGGKKLREEKLTGDKQTLEEYWFAWDIPGFFASKDGSKFSNKTSGELKAEARQQVQDEYNARRASEGLPPKDLKPKSGRQRTNRLAAAAQTAQTENQRMLGVKAATGMAVSFAQFMQIWNAYNQPIEVKVEALACSGGEKYLFRSLPGTIAEFALEKETLAKVRAACATLERLVKVFDKLAALAGISGGSVLKLCNVPDVTFAVEWKELHKTEDNGKLQHQVDREWEMTFAFETLVHWEKPFAIPIAIFLNFFAYGTGSTLDRLMRLIGLEATIGVEIEFKVIPVLWATYKAGAKSASAGGGAKIVCSLFFRVKVGWNDAAELSVGAVVEPEFRVGGVMKDQFLFNFQLEVKAELKVGLKGHYRVNFLGETYGDEFNYFPEGCKLSLPEFYVKPLSILKG